MKKTLEKINETKSCFSEKINKIDVYPDSLRKKVRELKSIKLEMEKEKIQLTSRKYKGS